MDHAPFLKAIATKPHDSAERLVYADWLEEQGDRRGELIRVMETMNDWPAYSDEFWNLRTRRAELKRRVSNKWMTALGYHVYRPLFGHMPKDRSHRWRLMIEFIETWHGPQPGNLGYPEKEIAAAEKRLGVQLPQAVREWYALAGRACCGPIGSKQDSWNTLDRLEVVSGDILEVRVENQACALWGVPLQSGAEDPPVIRVDGGEQECGSFSEFVLQNLLIEAIWTNNIYIGEGLGSEPFVSHDLESNLQCAQISEHYWCLTPVKVWEGPNLICLETQSDRWLNIATRTEEAILVLSAETRARLEQH